MTELDYKILELVLGTNTPISSKHLAASCDVAVNTIRSEIDLLNRDAERHGFRICMKRSIGVYCEVLDERRALPYFSHMQDFFMRARRIKKRYADRVYYLARQILSCPSGLTAEKLAQALYISRGTILHELKNLRSLLALFGLTLVNRRGGQGLGIEGTEWAIRQFLIHLHKNYTIARKSVKSNDAPHEYGFRTLFFMDEPCYNEIYCMLQQALLSQSDFTIPIIHFPKLINLLMLCASRKRYLTGQPFDEQGTQYLRSTPEYTFFSDFCRKLPPRFRQTVQSWEIDMLTALLISFESENSFLPRSEQGREMLGAVHELTNQLQTYFGFDSALFDDFFVTQTCCTLSRLSNQHRFGVINDPEPINSAQRYGIATANLCLVFARFYARHYGYCLSRADAMENFFVFNRLLLHTPRQFYTPNVAIVSEFGISYAKAFEERLRLYYGESLGCIEGMRYADVLHAPAGAWDLLITDMSRSKIRRYFSQIPVPVLSAEISLQHFDCPELDIWLDTNKQDLETHILRDDCFHHVHLRSKDQVFDWLEEHHRTDLQALGLSVAAELRRNDALINLERENEIVFLPVLLPLDVVPRVTVLLNDVPIVWNHLSARVFVFYLHGRCGRSTKVLSSILRRLLYMSSETRRDLFDTSTVSPLLLFYPNE